MALHKSAVCTDVLRLPGMACTDLVWYRYRTDQQTMKARSKLAVNSRASLLLSSGGKGISVCAATLYGYPAI